jgi:carbon-monoxide dehydrogenase small subunit
MRDDAAVGRTAAASAAPGPIRFSLNGQAVTVDAPPERTLLDVLRSELALPGTKESCSIGVCGACSVLVDDRLVSACLLLVGLLDGRTVDTVEGLGTPDDPSVVQRAFLEAGGYQCGICTPGQVVAATALLRDTPDPDDETIRRWMAGNLCRCTGYASILEAVRLAASSGRADRDRDP